MDRKPTTGSFSPESGKELAKVEPSDTSSEKAQNPGAVSDRASTGFGKGTAKYWEGKVYLPRWRDADGVRRKVSNYFVRIMVSGRREAVALNTADRIEAGKRAARLYDRIRTLGWEAALRDFDPERHTPKCAVTIRDAVSAIARADLRDRTKDNYVSALRWFAARHIGFEATKKTFGPEGAAAYRQQVESVRLTDLSNEVVQGIVDHHINLAGNDANAQRSARISTASFLRNAKAALRAAESRGVNLPEPRPFAGVKKPEGATPPPYTSTFDAGKVLRKAKGELKDDAPAYMALLLALGAGLRRGEIQNLRWRHVDDARSRILVLPLGGWAPKTLESEQPVPVSKGLIKELRPHRGGADDLVTTPSAVDRAVRYLRKQGIDVFKPLHLLRKEFGSIINESSDIFTASKSLRHSSVAVTAAVYVDSRKHVAPDIDALLGRKKGRR